MSENMVERVARAIQATRGPRENRDRAPPATRQLWLSDARAAIEAMREPTTAMIAAADALTVVGALDYHTAIDVPADHDEAWRAMIDAALAETAGTHHGGE